MPVSNQWAKLHMPFPLRAFVAASLFLAACAARGPSPETVANLARADELAVAGCYACLQQALAIFDRELRPERRAPAGLAERAFETAMLIVLREKELGIPIDASLARARALAQKVTPLPGAVAPAVLLELAELAPGETNGLDPDRSRPGPDSRARLANLRSVLDTATPPSLLATYLVITIDCIGDPREKQKIDADQILATHKNPALLRYRLGLCFLGPPGGAPQVRQEDARWLDTLFFEGRRALASRRPNLRGAIEAFDQAHKAFPASPAILLALAHAQRGYGDLDVALASYDRVIAMVPAVRAALLGRVITLSYLNRPQEAIDTATRMIDLGTWLMSDAYYWRAWNRSQLKLLEEAWSDAERAVQLSANTNVYTLAGVIAYDRKQIETAKDMFFRATQMDNANCSAHSYLGLVHVAQNAWPQATPSFSTAMSCFVQAAAQARRELAELQAETYDPVYTGRLAADRQKTIDESERKAAEAAYNAAQGYLRAGQRGEALGHLQLALEHPTLQKPAEALRKLIGAQ